MRARLFAASLLGLVGSVSAFGQYAYDISGSYVNAAAFSANGTYSTSATITQFTGGGGSLILPTAISGANANDYEVNTVLGMTSAGGTFIHYVRASTDARASLTGGGAGICAGSYISVEAALSTAIPAGAFPVAAQLNVNQCVSGSLSNLGGGAIAVGNGTDLRTVAWGTNLWVFLNAQMVYQVTIPATTGHPGIGGYGMTANGFTLTRFGHRDTTAPLAVSSTGMRSSVFPTNVALAWQGAADDANGIGVYGYKVTRSGATIDVTGAEFGDATVSASTTYTYSIAAMDYHGNIGTATSVTVTTPPATAVDPRRVGLSTTGSYWGGGGEQIDTQSGNVNFTLPLVKAQGRTGWTVPVSLNYNSQNWRQDSGTNWNLGTDVGFGYGWKAQIGSITPYYNADWTVGVDHYIFTDGTGAEYRLDQNTGTVWSSRQGIYVWFDSVTNVLHFKDGTSWVMGAISGGAEPDAGTMYPTIMQDGAGNQVQVAYQAAISLPGSEQQRTDCCDLGRAATDSLQSVWRLRAGADLFVYV